MKGSENKSTKSNESNALANNGIDASNSVQISDQSADGIFQRKLKSLTNNPNQDSIAQRKESSSPLPENVQTKMEQSMGSDFSDVNIHTNSSKAPEVGAAAFAQGNDVHFAPGQFKPETNSGQQLIGHELAHVVQQREGRVKPTTEVGGMPVNNDPGLETEADNAGVKAANFQASTSSPVQSKSLSSSAGAQFKMNSIQRSPIPGMIVEKTKLKQNVNKDGTDSPMPSKTFGSSFIGDDLNPGTIVPGVDFNIKEGGYYQTTYQGGVAWLDMTKTIDKNLTQGDVENDDDSGADDAFDRIGDASDLVDGVAGGLENTWLKGVSGKGGINSDLTKGSGEAEGGANGKFGDLKNKDTGVETAKNAGDFAAGSLGALNNLWGMKKAAVDFHENPNWKSFGEGAESLVSGVANGAKAVDGMAKALGNENGTGDSDIVGKYTGAINDGVSSVKNAFLGFTGLWKLYNSPSNTKGKDALVHGHQITKAALDAAKVAKSAYDIIGKGIPGGLITAIPGLSIAVSAINLIIRFADAWQAGDLKDEMALKSEVLRPQVAGSLGEVQEKSEAVFREDKRGIWPSYKTYYRIQPEILPAIDDAYKAGKTADTNQADESTIEGGKIKDSKEAFDAEVEALTTTQNAAADNKSKTAKAKREARDLYDSDNANLSSDKYRSLYNQWKTGLAEQEALEAKVASANEKKTNASNAMSSLPDQIVKDAARKSIAGSKLKPGAKASLSAQVTDKASLEELKITSDRIREYEVVDKMAEINQKRKVSGYSDVAKEMINITADIVTLTGVGAIVGAAMKGVVAAETLAHAGAKGVQKAYRNNKEYGEGEIDKSSKQKHQEYVSHTQHIFRMLSSSKTEGEAQNVLSIMKATGVNTGMMFALNGEPAKQGEMMVKAMKKRD